jgi:hypothetical protein
MSYIGIIVNRLIKKYGQTVNHKRRTQVDLGNGEVEYDYEVQEPKTGQFSQITPLDIILNRFGERVEADYVGTFLPGVDILEGDLLEIDDNWYEVQNVMTRRTSGIPDYIEVLLRRRQ